MHLVLGSQRHDLRHRTVVIARVPRPGHPASGADALWASTLGGVDVRAVPVPVGVDASDADDVHRLADAGVAAVAIRPGDREACAAAAERDLTVLLAPDDVAAAAAFPAERVLVANASPIAGGVACFTPDADGPAAWGAVTWSLAEGVRVLRTSESRSVRRVATVVERLVAAREGAQ